MNIYGIVAVVYTSIILILLIHNIFLKPKSRQIYIFILLTLLSLFAGIINIILNISEDAEIMHTVIKLNSVLWVLLIACGIMFVQFFYFDDNFPSYKFLLPLLGGGFVFLLRAVTGTLLAGSFFIKSSYVYISPGTDSIWYYFYIVYCLMFIVINYYLLIKKLRETKSRRIKLQSRIYMAAITIPIVIMSAFDIIEPLILNMLPYSLGYLSLLPYLVILLFALKKFRFMRIDIPVSMELLVQNINSIVIFFDVNTKLVFINNPGKDLLGYSEKEAEEFFLDMLFAEKETIRGIIEKMNNNSCHNVNEAFSFKCPDGSVIPMYTSISVIHDEFEDHIGFIVTGRRFDIMEETQKKYKLTQREMTVLTVLLMGTEYNDIAGKLNISRFTVKNHMHNIYQKTNAKNRTDLIKKCFLV